MKPEKDRSISAAAGTAPKGNNRSGSGGVTARQSEAGWRLLLRAVGGPRAIAGKIARVAQTIGILTKSGEIDRRLERLRQRGHIAAPPSRLQLAFGGLDMLRYFIVPGARAYYESRGIGFTFHQVLRFLDDPVSVIDPVGLLSDRDVIIGHLMQVVHANPSYDLQLLEMFDDGLEELQSQLEAMCAGTHPRAATIGAIVEDADYHRRLLSYVRAFPGAAAPIRDHEEARRDPGFVLAERTFGELPSAMRYMSRLPRSWPALIAHRRKQRSIDPAYCDKMSDGGGQGTGRDS